MLAKGEEITGLIPQKPPMVMIDALLECNQHKTVTNLTVSGGNIFVKNDYLTEAGLIENMAQTAAARNGWLAKKQKGDDRKALVGYIGAVKNFRLHFTPPVSARLTTTIEITGEYMNALAVTGKVETEGKIAAECELKIFTKEEEK